MDNDFRELDRAVRAGIVQDPDLIKLLLPFFGNEKKVNLFVRRSLRNINSRRSLLRVQWYSEIADSLTSGKHKSDALGIIFLMAMAEAISMRYSPKKLNSFARLRYFFTKIETDDKERLRTGMGRLDLTARTPRLQMLSIIKILYEVRNRAVHGEDFWSFIMPNSVTSGYLGKRRGKKRRVSLDIKINFQQLKEIVIRTALRHIESKL